MSIKLILTLSLLFIALQAITQ